MTDADLIVLSLERVGEVGGDITPLVYARLFAEHPDMEALFARDRDGSVKGEMLARVFDAILDFIDRRAYAARMIQCEVVTHEGYGVPPEVFGLFFATVGATVAEVLDAEWTAAMAGAWTRLLADLDWYATHSDQTLAAPAPALG